jgi:hypothetical protein
VFALQPAGGWEPSGGAAAILAAPRSTGIPWALPAVPALRWRPATAALGALTALVLLVPMVFGMLVLSHQDAANGPHEMFVYVQTTPDVQRVMGKIGQADAALYGGQHQVKIAIGTGEEWPFYWYLRDYWLDPHPSTYVYWDYPVASANAPQEDVLILTQEDAATFMAKHPTGYREQVYSLRSWWDEGYKPLPCIATATKACSASSQWGSGVGLGVWLSYGDTPPPNAHFNPRLATGRLWNWLWHRTALGSTQGSYNFVFIVRNGVPIQP